jgi:hypothetical protein
MPPSSSTTGRIALRLDEVQQQKITSTSSTVSSSRVRSA